MDAFNNGKNLILKSLVDDTQYRIEPTTGTEAHANYYLVYTNGPFYALQYLINIGLTSIKNFAGEVQNAELLAGTQRSDVAHAIVEDFAFKLYIEE